MKLISELKPSMVEKIIETLKDDGFKNIKLQNNIIYFEEGDKIKRKYEILSTELDNNDDLGVRTDFNFSEFLKTSYDIKTRHSVSLEEAINNHGSVEDACSYLDWKIIDVKDLNLNPELWNSSFHFDIVYSVIISNLPHIIVNDTVYAGELEKLLSMGSKTARQLLSGYKISHLLDKLNKE